MTIVMLGVHNRERRRSLYEGDRIVAAKDENTRGKTRLAGLRKPTRRGTDTQWDRACGDAEQRTRIHPSQSTQVYGGEAQSVARSSLRTTGCGFESRPPYQQ